MLELLAAVCLVRGGHDIILAAFDNFKEVSPQQGHVVPTLTPVLWLASCLSFPVSLGNLSPRKPPSGDSGMLWVLGLMSLCQCVSSGPCPRRTRQ